MRDIDRIDKFCNQLAEYWKQVPDWRFSQLIINVFSSSRIDPWVYEEEDMLRLFEKYFKKED